MILLRFSGRTGYLAGRSDGLGFSSVYYLSRASGGKAARRAANSLLSLGAISCPLTYGRMERASLLLHARSLEQESPDNLPANLLMVLVGRRGLELWAAD